MYRGKNGRIILKKEDWLKDWDKAILDSGYLFVLNVNHIRKQITEKEMLDCSPDESAWFYINLAKEVWNADKNGGL